MNEPPLGTIFCVKTRGFIGWLIRLATRSHVNHSFIYVGNGQIVEARARGAVISQLASYARAPKCDNAPQTAKLGPTVQQAIAAHALNFAHDRIGYGFLDIASLGLIHLGIRWRWLMRIVAREHRLICSQLVALAWAKAGQALPDGRRLLQDVTPGSLEWMIARRAWER